MALELPKPHREAIVEHARGGDPEEVVGVLAGAGGAEARVERRYPAENASGTPETRYEIAPEAELGILERIDDAGLDVVGFYHSHPRGPLEPSATDAALAAWPGRAYVIVSLADGSAEIGSWRWRGDRFEREPVRVVE